jgi:hypothetical protein
VQQNVEPSDIQGERHHTIELSAGRSQGKHAANDVAMRGDAIDLRRDEETGTMGSVSPPGPVGHISLFGRWRHRCAEDLAAGIDTRNIGEIIQPLDRIGQRRAAVRCARAHFRLIGEGAQDLFAGRKHVLLVGRAAARCLNEAVADVVEVALDTIDALNHADDRGRHQPDDDPEQKTEAQRSPADFRRCLIFCLMLHLASVRRGEPSGQAAP